MESRNRILWLFPDLFDVVDDDLYFKDKCLCQYALSVSFMDDPLDWNAGIYPKKLNPYNKMPISQLNVTIRYDEATQIEWDRSGELELSYWTDLSDALCMKLFKHNIVIKYPEFIYNEHHIASDVVYHYYDQQAITRRHTINEIIS